MSRPLPAEAFALAVGGSRLSPLPEGWPAVLMSPGGNPVLKQERNVLIWRLELPTGGMSIVKLYRHRNAWNRFRGGFVPFRVQREFKALCVLADGGVPGSVPLLWGHGRAKPHGWFEILVTREIAGAVNLKQQLAGRESELRPTDWPPLFDSLRRMHECGVYHGALWPKNILLTRAADGTPQFHVIDLARSVLFPRDVRGTSMARFDVLSLVYSLIQSGADLDAPALLRRYGWTAVEANEIAGQARRYRSSRHLRNRLALMFQLRARLAHWTARS